MRQLRSTQAMLGEAGAQLVSLWCARSARSSHLLAACVPRSKPYGLFKLFVVPPSVQDVGDRACGVRKEKALPKILGKK